MSSDLSGQFEAGVTAAAHSSRDELIAMIETLYAQVKRISSSEMRRQFAGRRLDSLTLSPTAIANDAMIRVLNQRSQVQNETQFFALAARFIRQLVTDYQKHRLAEKRGKGMRGAEVNQFADQLAADQAGEQSPVLPLLDRLADAYPRKAEVVTLHILCGKTFDQIARTLGISRATVERDWSFAKAWFADELRK